MYFKKFLFSFKFNLKNTLFQFSPIIILKAGHQKLSMNNDKKDLVPEIEKKENLELKYLIKGEYENKIRAFSSIEKKFFVFSKKDLKLNYSMDYIDFFDSLIPFPYTKVLSKDDIHQVLEKNQIYKKYLKKIDVNMDGKISFEEYIIFNVLMTVPITFFENFSKDKDKKFITREDFIEAIIKFIYEKNIIKITNKSLIDSRIVKTDYNTLYVDLTTFTSKAFKNVNIDIKKEILEFQNGIKFAVLLYEFSRFPESNSGKIKIKNLGRVLISYINIYKKQIFLEELRKIVPKYKDEEVTIEEFISFFKYLDYLLVYLKEKHVFEKKGIIRIQDLYNIEGKFRQNYFNPFFKAKVNKKHIQLMFDILDTDNSGYLDIQEIEGILFRRNKLNQYNTDYLESRNSLIKNFKKGFEAIKNNLWFIRNNK